MRHGEPAQRNAVVATVRREELEQRNAAVQHEEREGPDAERRRPSVFQAVPVP